MQCWISRHCVEDSFNHCIDLSLVIFWMIRRVEVEVVYFFKLVSVSSTLDKISFEKNIVLLRFGGALWWSRAVHALVICP